MARNESNERQRDSEGRFTSDDQRTGARGQSGQGHARNESHGPQHGSMDRGQSDRKRDEEGRFTSDSSSRGAKSDPMKRSGL